MKHTRVSRALMTPDTARNTIELPIPQRELETSTYVARLSFAVGSRVPADEARVVETLGYAENYALFLDGSVVGRTIDYPLFDELLRVPRRLFLIGRVLDELVPHFREVPDHPLRKAMRAKNPAFVVHPEPKVGSVRFTALHYYLNLLARRREVLTHAVRRYEAIHREEPDDATRQKIHAEAQSDFRERGMLLARKPISPIFTDEILVYLAVEHAVRTGQPTIILTNDPDVEEQFLKLIELVTMHYWAMLIAREYVGDITAFDPRPLTGAALKSLSNVFEGSTLLNLKGRRIQDFHPTRYEFVPIGCMMVGSRYVSHLVYGAETEMADVLDIKGRTLGLSTDLLLPRDLHAYHLPEIPGYTGSYDALISLDRFDSAPGGDLKISKLDGLAAIGTKLNMGTVTAAPASSRVLLRQRQHVRLGTRVPRRR